jgi:hypothetical protein
MKETLQVPATHKETGRRLLRRLAVAAAVLVALAAVGGASASQPRPISHSSTFDSSNEGWVFASGTGTTPATWQAVGGNPGGDITVQLSPGGGSGLFQSTGSSNGGTWDAGNALGDYGGKVQVDLEGSDSTSDAVVGFFTNNADVVPCQEVGPLAAGWHTYWITLDRSGLDDCHKTDTPLTPAQATAALAGSDGMFAYVFDSDNGADTVNLDNASLAGPLTPVAAPSGTVTRKFMFTHTERKLVGTLTAPYDFSCAGKTRVTIFRKAKRPVKVATTTTSAPNRRNALGPATFSFKLKRTATGSYYASVVRATSSLDGNACSAAHSNRVTLR